MQFFKKPETPILHPNEGNTISNEPSKTMLYFFHIAWGSPAVLQKKRSPKQLEGLLKKKRVPGILKHFSGRKGFHPDSI